MSLIDSFVDVAPDYGGYNPLDFSAAIDTGATYNAGSLSSAFGSAIDLTKSLAGAYLGIESAGLQIAGQKNAIDLAKVQGDTQQKLAIAQAQYQLQAGQRQIANASLYDSLGISTTLGNMQRLAAGNGGSNLMLWLTVAGLALAYLQYAKR